MNPFVRAINILNQSGVDYVIAGGFAVVMHGNNRFTPDINIVIPWDDQPGLSKLFALLKDLEFEARGEPESLFDQAQRDKLFESGRWFFSFRDLQAPTFSIDFFLRPSIPAEQLFRDKVLIKFSGGTIPICSLSHLLEMKTQAGRGQDKDDLENLKIIKTLEHLMHSPEAAEEYLRGLSSKFEQERVSTLLEFNRFGPDEKLEWLLEMLTHLGRFCVVG